MNWLSEKFTFLWNQCVVFYHVDPVIFLVTYIIKNIIFWWLTAYIVRRIIRRQWDGLALLVTINALVDVIPWVYVWIWGDNHPWWYPYMVYAIGGWSFVGIYLDAKQKTKKREQELAQQRATATAPDTVQPGDEEAGATKE